MRFNVVYTYFENENIYFDINIKNTLKKIKFEIVNKLFLDKDYKTYEKFFISNNIKICEIKKFEISVFCVEEIEKNIFNEFYKKFHKKINIYLLSLENYTKASNFYNNIYKNISISQLDNIFSDDENQNLENKYEISENFTDINETLTSDSPIIIKYITAIISEAIEKKVSDIHIEPCKDYLQIRFRIDGMLIHWKKLSLKYLYSIISRLKIMSNLDITEKRLPQDGKFSLRLNNEQIDFRLSTIPTVKGEKAVIRILDKKNNNFNLENISLSLEQLNLLKQKLQSSKGIIIASGPTGSGKSSLLYSILNELKNKEINISTVEDPVEFEIDGINQVQCNSEIGRDFATMLRAYLRQDPDVLMVGEIRDKETAEIAIKAAMTGHLVLSTIHTNDAISGIFRLKNLGIENYMIESSINLIIAQRLVRKICPFCKIIDDNVNIKLEILKEEKSKYVNKVFYKAVGCSHCNNTGYNGRIALYEMLDFHQKLRNEIIHEIQYDEIVKEEKNNGMKFLKDSGIEKALQGITTLDEIIRQC